MPAGEIAADAETDAGVRLRAQQLGDVFQPVMTAGAAFRPHPQRPERECDVVHHDQQILRRDLLGFHPVTDGFAREVHVGRRFEQHERASLVAQFGRRAVTARRKSDVGLLG